jgi:hypothetical protein
LFRWDNESPGRANAGGERLGDGMPLAVGLGGMVQRVLDRRTARGNGARQSQGPCSYRGRGAWRLRRSSKSMKPRSQLIKLAVQIPVPAFLMPETSVIASPSSNQATKRRRSPITKHSFHGIAISRFETESVTHVPGTKHYPCLGTINQSQACGRRSAARRQTSVAICPKAWRSDETPRLPRRAPPGPLPRLPPC